MLPDQVSTPRHNNGVKMPADIHTGVHTPLPWLGFWHEVFRLNREIHERRAAAAEQEAVPQVEPDDPTQCTSQTGSDIPPAV